MKMSEYFMCCEHCFRTICQTDTTAAKFWMTLCKMCLDHGNIIISSGESPKIRILEQLGFLVSTERKSKVLMKLKDPYLNEVGLQEFCLKEGCHE